MKYIPPRKGRANVLRLIRELLATEPVKAQTDISKALDFLGRVQRRRCVVFVMSDFLGPDCSRALAIANQRHDCVAVTMGDPRESSIPDVGFLTLRDAETDELLELDTRHPRVRALFAQAAQEREQRLAGWLRRANVDRLEIRTDQPYATQPAEVLSHAGAATMIETHTASSSIASRLTPGAWQHRDRRLRDLRHGPRAPAAEACRRRTARRRRSPADAIERSAEKGPVKLSVRVWPRKPRLSDLVEMDVRVESQPDVEIKPPAFGQAVGDFLIRDYSERPAEPGAGNVRRFHYQLEPAHAGKHLIRSVSIEFVDNRPSSERPRSNPP